MLIGYARTSTAEQVAGFEAQIRDLKALGCEKVFQEQVSSVASRAQLEAAVDYCREGDTLVVTKLDRLARSVQHFCAIQARLEAKGAALRVVSLGIDTGTPTGKLQMNLMASIAQFEREMMLERQREGVDKAKAAGKYKGRAPTALAKSDQVRALIAEGFSKAEAARRVGIGTRSVFRILEAQ
jgi:DNA invertase Pin-like site-specific DNA recombinase